MPDAATLFLRQQRQTARGPLVVVGLCTAGGAILLIVQYYLLARLLTQVVFDGAGLPSLWPTLWVLLALIMVRAATAWLAERDAVTAAGRVKSSVRQALLDHLLALGPVRLADQRTGDLAALLGDGIEALEPYYARFLPAITTVALVPLAVLVVVVPQDWISALVLAVTAPLIPLFMILIGKGAERLNQRQWARLARMSAHFLEVVQNLTTLKLFNASRREAQMVARVSEDYRLATMSVLRVAFLSSLALEFLATVSIAMVAVFIGFRLLAGDMDYQRGLFVLLLAPEFYLPLRSLGAHYHARMEAIGAATRMVEVLALPVPAATPSALTDPPPAPSLPATWDAIRFEGVGVTYPDGRTGLDGLNLIIEAGRITALVGASGAGKSTIASLLLGFIRPDRGHIRMGGTDLTTLPPESWRRCVAWVPQRPTLFRGTIADNIRLGCHASDDQVRHAARLAGAHDIITALPAGYLTEVREHGQGLSGGQIRLVALARAALRQAPLLVLDEPTASLDSAGETRVNEALGRLAAGRTVLVIAHRLATARQADTIAVIDRGRVSESGPHAQLLAAQGTYARLLHQGDLGGEA